MGLPICPVSFIDYTSCKDVQVPALQLGYCLFRGRIWHFALGNCLPSIFRERVNKRLLGVISAWFAASDSTLFPATLSSSPIAFSNWAFSSAYPRALLPHWELEQVVGTKEYIPRI